MKTSLGQKVKINSGVKGGDIGRHRGKAKEKEG
jgi:hypothetical protein